MMRIIRFMFASNFKRIPSITLFKVNNDWDDVIVIDNYTYICCIKQRDVE
jgi:hypothetical protein